MVDLPVAQISDFEQGLHEWQLAWRLLYCELMPSVSRLGLNC